MPGSWPQWEAGREGRSAGGAHSCPAPHSSELLHLQSGLRLHRLCPDLYTRSYSWGLVLFPSLSKHY